MNKINVNRFWVLNLWEAIDGETVEINLDPYEFINLDVSNNDGLQLITTNLLKPQIDYFTKDQQIKIKDSLFYDAYKLSENELLDLINYFGGTVFPTPNNNITMRELYLRIGEILFEANPDLEKIENQIDIKNENFRDF
jgi:hypothetical protein